MSETEGPPDARALIERATSVLPGEVATVEARFLHELADTLESALARAEAAEARAAKAEAEREVVLALLTDRGEDGSFKALCCLDWYSSEFAYWTFRTQEEAIAAVRDYCGLPPEESDS